MRRIGYIAAREFVATVMSRGFLVGLLIMPAMMTLLAAVSSRVAVPRQLQIQGEVAVIDPTGLVLPELRRAFSVQRIAERRRAEANLVAASVVSNGVGRATPDAIERAVIAGLDDGTSLDVIERPAADNPEAEKAWLTAEAPGPRRLAVVVIHPQAVGPDAERDGSAYHAYVADNLDDRFDNLLFDGIRDALVAARLRGARLDRTQIESMMRVRRVRSITVAKGFEHDTDRGFNRVLPFVFIGLLFFGIIIGGQGLLTSTIEEKSSRVIEVLLSAVSPFQLMAGKILGQLGVSFVVLLLYISMGVALLISFTLLGLLQVSLVMYLVIFFVIEFLTIASVMVAVGSAVNEVREAQTLMMPVTVVMILPFALAMPILRDPNSPLAIVASMLPPINAFAMLVRLTSPTPPPVWQVLLSIGFGLGGVCAAIWFASKVFRIGLLLHGKPPNFATLIRWARAA